jgi:foldase protein PrsA
VTRYLRNATGALALLVLPFSLAACGGGVPGNSVAKVGDQEITKSEFNRYLVITAKSSSQTPGQAVTVPDPPDFKKCAAAKAKQQPKGSTAPKQATSVYVKQCKQEYSALKEQTMGQLIQADWVQGEADAQGIKVSDKQVKARFQQQKKASFPKEKDFQTFLKQSGLKLDDILLRVKLDLLATKLRDKVTKGKDKVSEKQVTAYYDKNKSQFATPERRNIRMVMTRTKARAAAAEKAIKSGTSFKAVVKKYSTDPQTKSSGGLLKGVVKGQQDAKLDAAAFSAPKNKLEGPLKGQFGYYVYRVEKITPKTQQKLDDVKATIRQQLIAKNQQKALNDFIKDFRKRWTAKTECRKGYVVEGCKGAPKSKTSTAQQQPGQTPGQ